MYSGFGRDRGAGRGVRGGMGFGFRGSSPPWPYVGQGRGGLPRCAYYAGTPRFSGPAGSASTMTREEELNYLKNRMQAIKGELEKINARVNDLESKNATR